MLETKAVFRRKETEIETTDCVVEKVIELPRSEFDYFSRNLMKNHDFLRDNAISHITDEHGRTRCLLVAGEGFSLR